MSDYTVISYDDWQPEFDLDAILKKMHSENIPRIREIMFRLIEMATPLAKPQAAAILVPVSSDAIADNQIRVGNAVFNSALLREKVGDLMRVFPFIATEGHELAEWGDNLNSESDRFMARAIREAAVKGAQAALEQKLGETFAIPVLSCMNPGSIAAWPIEEQATLFKLLADQASDLSVSLLPSMLMKPSFSVSGIYFQTDKKYYNCQLCPRENCPNRKAKREI